MNTTSSQATHTDSLWNLGNPRSSLPAGLGTLQSRGDGQPAATGFDSLLQRQQQNYEALPAASAHSDDDTDPAAATAIPQPSLAATDAVDTGLKLPVPTTVATTGLLATATAVPVTDRVIELIRVLPVANGFPGLYPGAGARVEADPLNLDSALTTGLEPAPDSVLEPTAATAPTPELSTLPSGTATPPLAAVTGDVGLAATADSAISARPDNVLTITSGDLTSDPAVEARTAPALDTAAATPATTGSGHARSPMTSAPRSTATVAADAPAQQAEAAIPATATVVSAAPGQPNYTPLAGSPAAVSDDVLPSPQPAASVAGSLESESDFSQRRGKIPPPSGNSLPGTLPFLTNDLTNPLQSTQNQEFSERALQVGQQLGLAAAAAVEAPLTADIPELAGSTRVPLETPAHGSQRVSNLLTPESPTTFFLRAPVGSPDWNAQLGDRVRWMTRENIASAELVLHPAELGKVEIRITTENDQTRISFVTGNPAARELIEASLSRLRDMLGSSGLQLEQSDVSQQNFARQDGHPTDSVHRLDRESEPEFVTEAAAPGPQGRRLNQIDHYV